MKATGIVRRIDDLGRVVIPKEIRRVMRIKESDPLEIFTEHDGTIILKKYSPIGELSDFAKQYAESLSQISGHLALITDREHFIAASGNNSKLFLGQKISKRLEDKMNQRETIIAANTDKNFVSIFDTDSYQIQSEVIIPIITRGDVLGNVILISDKPDDSMSEVELKLAQSAADILGKQIDN